jgi:hypothetical protein
LTQFQNAEKSSLFLNVLYTKAVDHGTICFGPRRIHIILRKWNIKFHTSKYAVGWWGKRLFGRIALMSLSIGTLIWTFCQTGSYHNWTAMVLQSCSKRRTVYQHIMHSLLGNYQHIMHLPLGNTLLRISGNFRIVVSHQCYQIHWTVHPDAST